VMAFRIAKLSFAPENRRRSLPRAAFAIVGGYVSGRRFDYGPGGCAISNVRSLMLCPRIAWPSTFSVISEYALTIKPTPVRVARRAACGQSQTVRMTTETSENRFQFYPYRLHWTYWATTEATNKATKSRVTRYVLTVPDVYVCRETIRNKRPRFPIHYVRFKDRVSPAVGQYEYIERKRRERSPPVRRNTTHGCRGISIYRPWREFVKFKSRDVEFRSTADRNEPKNVKNYPQSRDTFARAGDTLGNI